MVPLIDSIVKQTCMTLTWLSDSEKICLYCCRIPRKTRIRAIRYMITRNIGRVFEKVGSFKLKLDVSG